MSFDLDTLFLDRDGVINMKLESDYVKNISEFQFISGVLLALNKLSRIFERIIVVTNQQCIGKGIISDLELASVHQYMISQIRNTGGKIDRVYYRPHLVSDQCNCRKPKSGMILQAMSDFSSIKTDKSYLIGDSDSDIEAGKKENLHTIKVDNNYTLIDWTNDLLKNLQSKKLD